MRTYPTEEQILAVVTEHFGKLAALGDAEQLAVHFADREMKAVCLSATRCALAESFTEVLREAFPGEYLRMSVGTKEAAVEQHYAGTGSVDRGWYTVTDEIALTPEMSRFISKFDQGLYPELLAAPDVRVITSKICPS